MNFSTHKKKVLITIPSLEKDQGGVANYYNAVLPHLYRSNDFEIEIFEIGSTHGKQKIFHQITDQVKFIRKIKSSCSDIVHVNPSLNLKSYIRDGLFIFWAKQFNIHTLVFFRGWEKKFAKQIKGLLKLFFNLTYKKANSFIVLASEFKKKLKSWGINQPVHLLTTAVDDALIKNFSIENKLKRLKLSGTIRILFLSRLETQKGIFETIDAFKLLLDKKYNIALSIAGDGSITKQVSKYIAKLDLKNKICMLGYVRGKEKIKVFTEHDVYCFPTYHDEGLPNSVLEAMAFGMPVITTPVGGVKDFFVNEKMGYLCSVVNPEKIARGVETIICDKNRLCNIAFHNYSYAKQYFIAPIVADKLLNIYKT